MHKLKSQRLNKILANHSICLIRKADYMIRNWKILINGLFLKIDMNVNLDFDIFYLKSQEFKNFNIISLSNLKEGDWKLIEIYEIF